MSTEKTIGINKGLKLLLNQMAEDGETMDATVSRLLDECEETNVLEIDTSKANIHISEDTFQRLNDAKLFSTEAYNSVIFRLIQSQN